MTITGSNIQNNINLTEHINSFHNDEQVETRLLQLVKEFNAPDYAYKKILNWARDAYNTEYKFNPTTIDYKSRIRKMEKYSSLNILLPYTHSISLPPDNLILTVSCFDFSSMLCSLLNNKELNQLSNLVVNQTDAFAKYVSPTGKLGEVNSGSWYQDAYKNLVKKPSKDFLLPIIFAMDKTTISSTSDLHVYAIMFTTTIFNCKT